MLNQVVICEYLSAQVCGVATLRQPIIYTLYHRTGRNLTHPRSYTHTSTATHTLGGWHRPDTHTQTHEALSLKSIVIPARLCRGCLPTGPTRLCVCNNKQYHICWPVRVPVELYRAANFRHAT